MHRVLTALVALAMLLATVTVHADIYRLDNGQVIPGTEGITPGPGIDLSGGWNNDSHNLRYADFSGGLDLSGAKFATSWLDFADFQGADLVDADLSYSALANARLTGTTVTRARFVDTTSRGFTAAQLYSTRSYLTKDVSGIDLSSNDLSGWDFHDHNLSNAMLFSAALTSANLTGANLTQARLYYSALTNANLTDADLNNRWRFQICAAAWTCEVDHDSRRYPAAAAPARGKTEHLRRLAAVQEVRRPRC